MSKAFTKEDDDAGFTLAPAQAAVPPGPFHLTRKAAEALSARAAAGDARAAEALVRAEVLPDNARPEVAALGVTVVVARDGTEARYVLASAEQVALLGEGCSVRSPLGRALLGARPGDVREATLAGEDVELEVVALEGDD